MKCIFSYFTLIRFSSVSKDTYLMMHAVNDDQFSFLHVFQRFPLRIHLDASLFHCQLHAESFGWLETSPDHELVQTFEDHSSKVDS